MKDAKRTMPESDELLSGRLHTWVVGTEPYRSTLRLGCRVSLVPGYLNPSDPNVIQVYNEQGGCCGLLSAYDARYLAPLLRREAIVIEPEISGELSRGRVAILLRVRVLPRGAFIFDDPPVGEPAVTCHRELVAAWKNVKKLEPFQIRELRAMIRPFVHGDLLPFETQFLYRLLKGALPENNGIAIL